jgi:hypothetical protein
MGGKIECLLSVFRYGSAWLRLLSQSQLWSVVVWPQRRLPLVLAAA